MAKSLLLQLFLFFYSDNGKQKRLQQTNNSNGSVAKMIATNDFPTDDLLVEKKER
jgi:hypothetical protein